ncbi:SCO7613 C-terminal domain-containing membrane protein, partial [Nocardioides marmoraquaticus]
VFLRPLGLRLSARAATGRLVSPQVAAVLGAALLALAQVSRPDPAPAAAALVPVLLVAAAGARVLRLPLVALGVAGVGAQSWVALVVAGIGRAADAGAVGSWWWPLVAAALEAAVVTVLLDVRRVGPARLRSLGPAAVLLPLLVLATCPALVGTGSTATRLSVSGSLAVLLVVVAAGPELWARAAAGFAVLVGAVVAVPLLVAPVAVATPRAPQPLTWIVDGLVLAAAVPLLLGLLRGRGVGTLVGSRDLRRAVAAPLAVTIAVATTGLGVWAALVVTDPAPAVAVAAGLVVTAATGALTWRWREVLPTASVGSALTAWTAGLALWNAGLDLDSPLPAAAQSALAVPLLVAGLARDRDRRGGFATALLTAGALLGAAAVQGWSEVTRLDPGPQAALLAAYAVGLVLAASTVLHLDTTRVVVQLLVVPVTLLALFAAPDAGPGSVTLAVVAGALAVGALLQRARDHAVPLPGAVAAGVALVAAGWRALAGLPSPELVSLPAGAVLALGGAWLLLQDRRLPSAAALAPGLVTVLAPSLLLALGDPVSLRGAVVALLVVALLGLGIVLRLGAPFVAGAVGSALLLLAHLEPVAAAVPRWMVIGLVGGLLLAAGITWESGLRRLAGARRYLAALR